MDHKSPPSSDQAKPAGQLARINADVRRQAVPSLNGYGYQIWHSVLVWLDLSEGEAIDLEGNEDIDRVASLPTRAQALSQLLGVLKAPIQKLVGTIAAPNQKLVRTIAAVRDAKQASA